MDPTKISLRYLFSVFVAAVLTAAALRHYLHVQAGFSREEIRIGVFIVFSLGLLLAGASVWCRRRP